MSSFMSCMLCGHPAVVASPQGAVLRRGQSLPLWLISSMHLSSAYTGSPPLVLLCSSAQASMRMHCPSPAEVQPESCLMAFFSTHGFVFAWACVMVPA